MNVLPVIDAVGGTPERKTPGAVGGVFSGKTGGIPAESSGRGAAGKLCRVALR